MCDPVTLGTLAVVSIGATIGSGIYSANQQNKAGKAQQGYYNYIADQEEASAKAALAVGERNATLAQDAGAREAADAKRASLRFGATQQAALAANGVGGGSVTAADIAGDAFDKAKLDEIAIQYNANSKAAEAITDANYKSWDFKNQANLSRLSGVNARRAGAAQANATLFSTASSVATQAAGFGFAGAGKSGASTGAATTGGTAAKLV